MLRPSDPKTLVFLATYNEYTNIEVLLREILSLKLSLDILVVDDNSPDGTQAVIRHIARKTPELSLIVRSGREGLGSAHRLGWAYARQYGYDRLITLDADRSHDPKDIPRFLKTLDDGADFVIGSRFVEGGGLDYKGLRYVVSRAANVLARYLLWLPLHEYTTSYRAVRLAAVPSGLIETLGHDGYAFFLSSAVWILRAKVKCAEIPIYFHDRAAGSSKLNRWQIVRGIGNLLHLAIVRKRPSLILPWPEVTSRAFQPHL